MDILTLVERWILLYATRKKYMRVLQCFSQKVTEPLSDWLPPCALETFMLYQIIQKRDIQNYDVGMAIVTGLYPAISEDISSSIIIKIINAMKVVVLFELLKKKKTDENFFVAKLNTYFPRKGSPSDNLPEALRQPLLKHCVAFRYLFLPLAANPSYRQDYMKNNYKMEFGDRFELRLEQLVQRIVTTVDKKLPVCPIERILHDDCQPSFSSKLAEFRLAAVELLLDHCVDKDELTEQDCMVLLDRLRPRTASVLTFGLLSRIKSSYFSSQSEREQSEPMTEDQSENIPSIPSCFDLDSQSEHIAGFEDGPTSGGCQTKRKASSVSDEAVDPIAKRRLVEPTQSSSCHVEASDCAAAYPKGQVYKMAMKQAEQDLNKSDSLVGSSDDVSSESRQSGSVRTPKEVSANDWVLNSNSSRSCTQHYTVLRSHGPSQCEVPADTESETGKSTHEPVDCEPIIILSDGSDDVDSSPEQIHFVSSSTHDTCLDQSTAWHADRLYSKQENGVVQSSDADDTPDIKIIPSSPVYESEELDTLIVPSSYSVDGFATLGCSPSDVIEQTLPSLGKHLRHPSVRSCVIKLHHNKRLDTLYKSHYPIYC